MKTNSITPERMRQWLITFAICLSYMTFLSMGIIIAKFNPIVLEWTDLIIFPLSFSTILFIYMFAITYEKRLAIKLTDTVKECARLYGEGLSFEKIKEKLELDNLNDVKRLLTEFCKLRG